MLTPCTGARNNLRSQKFRLAAQYSYSTKWSPRGAFYIDVSTTVLESPIISLYFSEYINSSKYLIRKSKTRSFIMLNTIMKNQNKILLIFRSQIAYWRIAYCDRYLRKVISILVKNLFSQSMIIFDMITFQARNQRGVAG